MSLLLIGSLYFLLALEPQRRARARFVTWKNEISTLNNDPEEKNKNLPTWEEQEEQEDEQEVKSEREGKFNMCETKHMMKGKK